MTSEPEPRSSSGSQSKMKEEHKKSGFLRDLDLFESDFSGSESEELDANDLPVTEKGRMTEQQKDLDQDEPKINDDNEDDYNDIPPTQLSDSDSLNVKNTENAKQEKDQPTKEEQETRQPTSNNTFEPSLPNPLSTSANFTSKRLDSLYDRRSPFTASRKELDQNLNSTSNSESRSTSSSSFTSAGSVVSPLKRPAMFDPNPERDRKIPKLLQPHQQVHSTVEFKEPHKEQKFIPTETVTTGTTTPSSSTAIEVFDLSSDGEDEFNIDKITPAPSVGNLTRDSTSRMNSSINFQSSNNKINDPEEIEDEIEDDSFDDDEIQILGTNVIHQPPIFNQPAPLDHYTTTNPPANTSGFAPFMPLQNILPAPSHHQYGEIREIIPQIPILRVDEIPFTGRSPFLPAMTKVPTLLLPSPPLFSVKIAQARQEIDKIKVMIENTKKSLTKLVESRDKVEQTLQRPRKIKRQLVETLDKLAKNKKSLLESLEHDPVNPRIKTLLNTVEVTTQQKIDKLARADEVINGKAKQSLVLNTQIEKVDSHIAKEQEIIEKLTKKILEYRKEGTILASQQLTPLATTVAEKKTLESTLAKGPTFSRLGEYYCCYFNSCIHQNIALPQVIPTKIMEGIRELHPKYSHLMHEKLHSRVHIVEKELFRLIEEHQEKVEKLIDENAERRRKIDEQNRGAMKQEPQNLGGVSVGGQHEHMGYYNDYYNFSNNGFANTFNHYSQGGVNDMYNNPYQRRNNNEMDEVAISNLLDSIKQHEVSGEGLAPTPAAMNIQLLKHQRMGLTWMKNKEQSNQKGGILADDMGLGKTVQAISIILDNPPAVESLHKTTLVIAPVSLLRQWLGEFDIKLRDDRQLRCFIYHSNERNKIPNFEAFANYDVVMTSYQTLGNEFKKHYKSYLETSKMDRSHALPGRNEHFVGDYVSPFYSKDAKFYRIILDEAQNIKNKNTLAAKSVSTLHAELRWCLSGTPMQNNIGELYPLIRFLRIRPYNDETKFRTQIELPITKDMSYGKEKALQRLQVLLSAMMLRRTKKSEIDGQPILSLPPKHVVMDYVTLTDKELLYYQALETKSAEEAQKMLQHEKIPQGAYSCMLTLLLRLRQATIHNYMVKIAYLNGDSANGSTEGNNNNNNKFTVQDAKAVYNAAMKINENSMKRIEEEQVNGFVCPICTDTISNEDILFLGSCGHVVCKDCIDDFYDRFTTNTTYQGDSEAECFTCRGKISKKSSIEYNDFTKIRMDKVSLRQFQDFKGIDKEVAMNKKTRYLQLKEYINEIGELMISAKINKTIELIRKINKESPDEKIIIFSQFTFVFDIMNLIFANEGIDFLRYDGSMSVAEKDATISTFYTDPKAKLMLISLKAGNVGLTLTCASRAIILDEAWNPYVMRQAEDRLHRIGQQRDVYIHHILVKNTVEDRIMLLQKEKEELIEGAMDGTGRENVNRLGRNELGFLFGLNSLN